MPRYYFQEKDFPTDFQTFSTDSCQLIEDRIKLYSSKGRAEQNKHILFGFSESLRVIRKLEEEYLKEKILRPK